MLKQDDPATLTRDRVVLLKRERAGSIHEPKNYGIDISTLARLIERGEI
ncbi:MULTISPECIES: hypothetical protein [Burkholderiaceae]|nr:MULTISPECIES: hypothetical protein [Burkholderiaceae]MCF2135025.1 hypothetical protein [Mycetohabitans sp. B3]MCG1019536.1 hypothetical protein [Mycetohabitans sp. B4]MCG1040342.1 hypothetical protein [Mycetohabitans sp. B7]SIT71749.1 hypothetical protein SAMN04487768_2332 [Burkholderia sp. b13]SIT74103.1 hypothetical protein SAMN04487769_2344 [Burkholderia sp. b14]